MSELSKENLPEMSISFSKMRYIRARVFMLNVGSLYPREERYLQVEKFAI